MKKLFFFNICDILSLLFAGNYIPVLFFTPLFLQGQNYCVPASGDCGNEAILRVTFAGIDHVSDCLAGYEDYTLSKSANIAVGQQYLLSVTLPFSDVAAGAWIDYNHDKIFSASEFIQLGTTGNNTYILSKNITVPAGALNGSTRMRVKSQLATAIGENSSCSLPAWNNGETEDYTVIIDGVLNVPSYETEPFTFFPNPASQVLTFISTGRIIDIVTITEMSGKTLIASNLPNGRTLDISILPAGIYIITITAAGRKTSAKLVVK